MQQKLWNDNWRFLKTEYGSELCDIRGREREFRPVDIPHDWMIYNTADLYETSTGWYRRLFTGESLGLGEGEKALVVFDGVYMDSTVYLNGRKLGDWKYGYSTFAFDLTDGLKEGENELLVQVRFQCPNSRWYSGAGIYRNVWMRKYPRVYLPMDGTYVHTTAAEDGYRLEIETECAGAVTEDTVCRYSLWYKGELFADLGCGEIWQEPDTAEAKQEADGGAAKQETDSEAARQEADGGAAKQEADSEAARQEADGGAAKQETDSGAAQQEADGGAAKQEADSDTEQPELCGCRVRFRCSTQISGVREWDIEDPQCYQLRIELSAQKGAEPADTEEITIGFRRMEFDPDKGFFLNGRNVKVHGVCEHHDLGCLGAAFHKEAIRRKFVILKKMGVNALRTSHNMPAREVMELADEMGILVLSEAFDMWERTKTTYDYGRFFKEWAEKDVRSWIRRDRNHPSLFLWSIGNEIYDTHADAHGQEITRRLISYVRAHDPEKNALITIGSNYMPWEGAQNCADIVKMAGYNYGEKYYEQHHREHPDWIIYGSETASVVQSRGVYRFPLSQSVLADEDEQCSCLGNSSTSWGAKSVEKCITDDRDAVFSFGQFIWTGFDYIGEPTPYHTKNSYFGHIDTAGFPKDTYYIFQAEWTDAAKAPMVHLFPYWDFNEGQLVDVRACTNGSSVELFVNGESMGRQDIDHKHGLSLLGNWQLPYRQGEITAIAYDEDGREIARETRRSFTDSVRLTLEADKTVLRGDGEDLCFLTIGAADKDGCPVENAMDYVEISVTGSGRLLGMDNGDSTDYDAYKGNVRKLFNGKLLAVVASKAEAGEIQVKVSSPALEGAQLTLHTVEAPVREGISIAEDVQLSEWEGAGAAALPLPVPVRRIDLRAEGGCCLNAERPCVVVEAAVCPKTAADRKLIWKAVNQNGIDVGFVKVEELEPEGGVQRARITALGDGSFWVRCLSKSSTDKVRIISQLDFTAEGLGQAYLNPYEFVSAGLFTDTIGEIGNGNEKGIATARDGASGVVYSHLDFGDYGSDEITMPVFALDSAPHPVEIWLGRPDEEGSELLLDARYQKPAIWNVYQEETWKLPRRIKGIADIAIRVYQKVHIKGFIFRRYDKAVSPIDAAECSNIYGDSFRVEEKAVTGIGNNVTIEYGSMDFGSQGVSSVIIRGRSLLDGNTVHLHFTGEDGEMQTRILEVKGTADYESQEISIEPLTGAGRLEFVFLPGTQFDMEGFQFRR